MTLSSRLPFGSGLYAVIGRVDYGPSPVTVLRGSGKGLMSLSAWIGGDRSRVDGRVWVNLRTLVAIRWLAVIGQAATLVFVQVSLGYPLPLATALLVVGASAAVNIVATLQRPAQTRLTDRDAAAYLAFDVFQLSGLLFLTGGLENPFAVLILAPVTVSATILSRPTTIGLCLFTLLAIVVLVFFRWPLPWPPPGLELPPMYRFGVAAALALATVFIAAYTWQVTAEARRLTEALAATQMALAREQQLSAVGRWPRRRRTNWGPRSAPSPSSPANSRASCRTRAVARGSRPARKPSGALPRHPGRAGAAAGTQLPFDGIALSLLVDLAAAPHLPAHIDFEIVRDGPDEPAEPIVPERPELRHALGNLLQNAFQFADSEVRATVGWDATEAWILVRDDGPGFRPEVLARIGEPYVSGRDRPGGSMGLGIFIAETLLARTGAGLAVENAASGGAEVAIRWHRDRLEGCSRHHHDRTHRRSHGTHPARRRRRRPLRTRLATAMERRGYQVTTAESVAAGIAAARSIRPLYAVCDLKLGDGNGLEVVQAVRAARPDARVVVLTGYGNIATAVAAVKAGAVDYLAKPTDADAIESALKAQGDKLPQPPEQPMSADRVRWEHIQRVFEQCDRNVSETARRLRMHRRTLQRILNKHAPRD